VPNLAPQSRVALDSRVSNTGCRSPAEVEMTLSTLEVAVCCSSASARCCCDSASSQVLWSSCFCRPAALGLRRRAALGAVPRFCPVGLRCCVFEGFRLTVPCRLTYPSRWRTTVAVKTRISLFRPYVGFGQLRTYRPTKLCARSAKTRSRRPAVACQLPPAVDIKKSPRPTSDRGEENYRREGVHHPMGGSCKRFFRGASSLRDASVLFSILRSARLPFAGNRARSPSSSWPCPPYQPDDPDQEACADKASN